MTGGQPQRRLDREDVIAHFRPMAATFDRIIAEARNDTTVERVKERFPRVRRLAHLRRLSGSARWMEIADGLVADSPDYPAGFYLASTESEHNQGQYAIRCPIGVLTVRREPHDESDDSKCYLQQALVGLDFDEGLDQPRPDARVYLSVPPNGVARLIVEHSTLSESMKVGLDELAPKVAAIAKNPAPKHPARAVRSTKSKPGQRKDV